MITGPVFPLLELIDTPLDLRCLPEARLPALAHELREFLIQTVARTGGHFSANLGTVELTIALHYIFDTPDDRLIWDVGHQTYPHKILTGRRTRMDTLRRKRGIAGFPKRCESVYDTFGVGHSSTSLSAALGMAIAAERAGSDRKIVAVIGDGAMTAGMAFEALNHAGHLKSDLLVILNDNDMSISPNVGALSAHLTKLLSGRFFSTVRESGKKVLSHVPPVLEVARRAEEHVKGMFAPGGTLFEELGFNYFGPVDGHDLPTLVQTLRNLRALKGPRLLHVVTRKGKGYPLAEDEPVGYHGVGVFDPTQGLKPAKSDGGPTYTQVFGEWLCDMAEQDERLIGITPAMREGSGLVEFAERFPERYFDVAIAEQHAVTLAAGMACDGLKPVVAIYSTFLQRAYDQLIHDVALQNLPVLFAIDRAGLVGPDGPTHAGSFDYSYLRCIPNLIVMAPADENECRQMLYTGFQLNQPAAVRYPRGKGSGVKLEWEMRALPIGQAEIRRRGNGLALLAFGSMVAVAEEVAERLDATVVNMRFIKPLDEALVAQLAAAHRGLVTLEENVIAGGAGSAVNECLAARGIVIPVRNIGLPDRFVEQGERGELLAECGLDAAGVLRQLAEWRLIIAAPVPTDT
ncbi:MAG: 1-deoxy-D-xylulose-5-phosphate synthase [Candidatus Competibacteraceae bacterium]|uniref:1-deoxy-D-xylulose-5-phosphate synthase n=1 Tax=Candidatus Contendobacter odensis Run_B_J11 TaxID=1400861 RepID=A0A7U7GDP4_9GAMM|nr:1-deoxy-D-xylulose-5-phosphate synthase [Candidatus Contendobacter odensis]MBK8533846.1 1-deoxy-D-xylulose-5-phosphate synthase [Candidatus Competibacteraceae bacterium]MBK8751299.1 1-deoxy-D-xylulose-5-phosphate synthase [Candidatus Competibacteraceae bacterium]CDH46242.1 1-deoxy-D-xylulose 5-phosphate synthase; flavoprotein, thiamin-binding [Candidatus Contendobacter odensis Run_B_J11]